ncbi:FAD-binding oxidoreductase [Desulfocicer niacini]
MHEIIAVTPGKEKHVVFLKSIEGAAQGVSKIIAGKIIPTTLEFMDSRTLKCIRSATDLKVPGDTHAVQIIEANGDRDGLDRQARLICSLIEPFRTVAVRIANTVEESEALWRIRRAVFPSLEASPDRFTEDLCVPRSNVPEMIRQLIRLHPRKLWNSRDTMNFINYLCLRLNLNKRTNNTGLSPSQSGPCCGQARIIKS